MDEPHATSSDAGRARKTLRRLSLLLAAFLGTIVGVAGVLIVVAVVRSNRWPTITDEAFEQAQQRWRQHGPADYNLEVKVSGPQPATYRVEVRQGEVLSAARNGSPLTQRRTFDTWSVPGMFATMRRDVENVQRVASGNADPDTPRLTLFGQFDPEYGYPQSYHRIQWGTDMEVSWEVTEFTMIRQQDGGSRIMEGQNDEQTSATEVAIGASQAKPIRPWRAGAYGP